MRTTSSLESFNAVLNRSIAKRPNFYKFVERLKLHESRAADQMYNAVHGLQKCLEPHHEKDRQRAEKIKHFTKLICNRKLTPQEFLNAMAQKDRMYYSTVFSCFELDCD